MKYVVIDLEMNPLSNEYSKEKRQCRSEVIQIGAVALDENYLEIDSFVTLVKPQYNERIIRRIEKLTGITTSMVREAPVFAVAIQRFFDWCLSLNDEIQILQWSEADFLQIAKEVTLKQIVLGWYEQRVMEGWKDFQYEFGKILGLSDQLSLKNAIMYAGIDIVGHYHDALYDARNTAKLFRAIRDPEECKKALSRVISALNPEPQKTTLGELFNLSEFKLVS